jgi:hypothetical protein
VIDDHRLTVWVRPPLRREPGWVGALLTAHVERFHLHLYRGEDGRPRYSGAVGAIEGPDDCDDERAQWGLLDRLGDPPAPRACFVCRWSDVESGPGSSNLDCLHRHREDDLRYPERCPEPGGPRVAPLPVPSSERWNQGPAPVSMPGP